MKKIKPNRLLKIWRKKNKIRQDGLAREWGVTQGALSKIETGYMKMSSAVLLKFIQTIAKETGDKYAHLLPRLEL